MSDLCAWLTILPAIIFLCGLIFIPASPRYLAIIGKPHTAKKILLLYRDVSRDTEDIQGDVDAWLNSKDIFPMRQLYRDIKYVKTFGPLLGLHTIVQLSGTSVLLFFMQENFIHIGRWKRVGKGLENAQSLDYF